MKYTLHLNVGIIGQFKKKIAIELINGTGNACAWQSSAKLSPDSWTKAEIFDELENVGALEPTGSGEIINELTLFYWLSV